MKRRKERERRMKERKEKIEIRGLEKDGLLVNQFNLRGFYKVYFKTYFKKNYFQKSKII